MGLMDAVGTFLSRVVDRLGGDREVVARLQRRLDDQGHAVTSMGGSPGLGAVHCTWAGIVMAHDTVAGTATVRPGKTDPVAGAMQTDSTDVQGVYLPYRMSLVGTKVIVLQSGIPDRPLWAVPACVFDGVLYACTS